MEKMFVILGISLLTIALVLLSSKIISAQPKAKKICVYPKYSSGSDMKLEDLKPSQAVCLEDEGTLSAFNSATRNFKFIVYQSGIYGTFTDEKIKFI